MVWASSQKVLGVRGVRRWEYSHMAYLLSCSDSDARRGADLAFSALLPQLRAYRVQMDAVIRELEHLDILKSAVDLDAVISEVVKGVAGGGG